MLLQRALLPCLTLMLAASAAAAPNPRPVGDGVVRVRSNTFLAGWAYDDAATRTTDDPFVTETVSAAVEVGVAPRLTLTSTLPFVWMVERAAPSPGDLQLGGLVALLDDDLGTGDAVDLAVSLDVKVPLYTSRPSIRGRDENGLPAIGDGQLDVTGAAVLVAGLPLGGAMDLYTGYRLRSGGVTDAVIGGGRIGIWLLDKRFFLSALLDTVVTLDVTDADGDGASDNGDVLGKGYAAIGSRLSIRIIERTYVDVGAAYIGRGTNAPGGVELSFGASAAF